jgi:uncharacterized protein
VSLTLCPTTTPRPPRRRPRRGLERLAALATVVVAGAGCDAADRPDVLALATAGTGGVYYVLGGAIAERWSRDLPSHRAVAEVTGGSVENMNLLMRGEVQVAFVMGTIAYQAYHGTGPFAGREPGQVAVLAGLYPNALHVVTLADAPVAALGDLGGLRVSVGAPGSGTEVAARTLLEANGITYDDLRVQRLNFNETASALRDGHIDAGFWSVGPPASSIVDLATTREIGLVPIGEDERARAVERDPTLRPYVIESGTYPGQTADVPTVSTPNVLVVRADLPDDLACALAASLFEGRDALAGVHPAARTITVAYTLSDAPIPLHAGLARCLEREGHEVPEHLLPPPA